MPSRFFRRFNRLSLARRSIRHYSAPGDRVIPQAKQKYVPTTGTYPKDFVVSSAHVGVKPSNTQYDDLALIASTKPCTVAGVFTKNRFKAAPVVVSHENIMNRSGGGFRAVVVNSGCANAVTGKGGIEDAKKMCEETDNYLPGMNKKGHLPSSLVMSTGVIGQRLPIDKILAQIPNAASSLGSTHEHWLAAAKAICTTDTFPKLISREFTLPSFGPDRKFRMVGMTKGAGMIHPNMGTLLGLICTDAPIQSGPLYRALQHATDRSFNSISIDGDTSTNDTVLILANGSSPDGAMISNHKQAKRNKDFSPFAQELSAMCRDLAHLIVRDGEGATKFVTIRVAGAKNRHVAHRLASTIARSPLVKTALYGKDANWGRILCAIGYAEGPELNRHTVNPEHVSVSFVPARDSQNSATTSVQSEDEDEDEEEEEGGEQSNVGTMPIFEESIRTGSSALEGELRLLVNGEPQEVDEGRAAQMLAEEDLEILVRLQPIPPPGSEEERSEREAIYKPKKGRFKSKKIAKVVERDNQNTEIVDDVLFWTCDLSHDYVTINGDYRT